MKKRVWMMFLSGTLIPWAAATVISTGEMRYPVNMGPASDPARIPVGSIPCESNHRYGILELISTPFPSVPGGWLWEGGIELNGNLPSAFGISVEPEDSTNVPASPVTLRVRKQPVPGYSPYTKEQVLLATLRCLLDTVRAEPKHPLTIEVVAEDPADAALLRFSGKYLSRPTGDEDFEETPLPGCVTMVDRNGVREIVFVGNGETPAPSKNANPLWMPFPVEGDSDPGFLLLPTWTGNRMTADRLSALGMPWPVVQDRYNPALGNPDGNLLTRQQLISRFKVERTGDKIVLDATMNLSEDWNLADGMALLCWASVLSEHPTGERPLEITLRMSTALDPRFQSWLGEGGWEQVQIANDVAIRATFAWDPDTGALTQGFIPKYRVDRLPDGGWEVMDREAYERAHKAATGEGLDLP